MFVRMYDFFIILLQNYENDRYTHNYFSLFSYWHPKFISALR